MVEEVGSTESPSGPPATTAAPTNAPTNVVGLLAAQVASRPDEIALVDRLVDPHRSLTWADLGRRVDVVAAESAHRSSLVAGQRVAICGPNSLAWVVTYLAALRAGLVVVPIDPAAPPSEQAHLLRAAGVHVVWGAAPAETPGDSAGVRAVLPLVEDADATSDPATEPTPSPADPESLAVLAATGGTSGLPKLAMLSHRALLANVDHSLAAGLVRTDDVLLAVLPFSHVFGFNALLGGWLGSGARLVLAGTDPAEVLAAVEGEQATSVPLTPGGVFRLRDQPRLPERTASVQRLLVAGAGLPWRLGQEFAERSGHRVERAYGLTEAAPGVTTTVGTDILGPTHVGRPLPGVEVRVGTGRDPGEPGAVWIRGANLFGGYWPDAADGPDADGWFDTGDVGYQVGDDLFVVDRARELVTVKGFTVYPSEVEQAVRDLPGVTGVAALGAGEGRDQRIVLFVAGPVSAAEVLDHCRSRLAPFKRPAEVRLVGDLPRSVTGRVLRNELRRLVRAPEPV